jgi:hypothetical protein
VEISQWGRVFDAVFQNDMRMEYDGKGSRTPLGERYLPDISANCISMSGDELRNQTKMPT